MTSPSLETQKCVKRFRGYRCHIKLMTDGTIRYHYDLTMHMHGASCTFSLFEEIGQPYKERFETLIKVLDLKITRGHHIGYWPWVADKMERT